MDNKAELIDALLQLGKMAERVAGLLSSQVVQDLRDGDVVDLSPDKSVSIDLEQYKNWPLASLSSASQATIARKEAIKLPITDGMYVLEYNCGFTYPISQFHKAHIDIIADDHKFVTDNCRIIKDFSECRSRYDLGVVWESCEFMDDPYIVLAKMSAICDKLVIKFRPWTSRDGAFQSYTNFNKAYIHLLTDINNDVKWKVNRPLATYDALFKKLGLLVINSSIESIKVEGVILDENVLKSIISRTWGNLRDKEAYKILMTNSVQYTVAK